MFFLELGILRLRDLIMIRRILYLYHIMKQNENSLLLQFFKTQMKSPIKVDWTTQVLKDMNEIKLNIDIQDIPKFSQSKFKNIVKGKVRLHAFKQLLDDKNKRMSEDAKGKLISYKEFDMQSYLKPTKEYISMDL